MIQFRHMKLARWLFTVMAFGQFACVLLWLIFLASIDLQLLYTPGIEPETLLIYLRLLAVPLFSGLFLAVLAMCTWVESWTLTESSLTHAGLFRTRKIELNEIEKIRWWPINRMILVYGSGTRIPIFIDSLTPKQRAQVIEQLHQIASIERQTGWEFFERRAYQPLLNKLAQEQQAASTDSAE